MDHLSEVDAAWLGGLFEGECCIDINANRSSKIYYRLRIEMTDWDVLNRVVELIGNENCTFIQPTKKAEHHKQSWLVSVHKRTVLGPLLTRLLPYFGERRSAKAREVLASMVV